MHVGVEWVRLGHERTGCGYNLAAGNSIQPGSQVRSHGGRAWLETRCPLSLLPGGGGSRGIFKHKCHPRPSRHLSHLLMWEHLLKRWEGTHASLCLSPSGRHLSLQEGTVLGLEGGARQMGEGSTNDITGQFSELQWLSFLFSGRSQLCFLSHLSSLLSWFLEFTCPLMSLKTVDRNISCLLFLLPHGGPSCMSWPGHCHPSHPHSGFWVHVHPVC